jgi:oligoendopeptidase F
MKQLNWNLKDILPLKEFDSLYSEIESNLPKYDKFYKKFNSNMSQSEFKKFIFFEESMMRKQSRLISMPHLMEAVNQKSETARLLKTRAEDLLLKYTDVSRKSVFWIKGLKTGNKEGLDNKNAKRLFSSVPDLTYVLTYYRESAKHTLSENEERIIDKKDLTGNSVLVDLRTMIQTEFKYLFKPSKSKKGKLIETEAELLLNVHSRDEKKREAAYISLLSKHKENIDKFFIIYSAIAKDEYDEVELRKYKSPISVRNHHNHVSDEAIQTLLDVCTKNRFIFQDYFRFKAKELGMKKLRRFDIYAPLNEPDMKIGFEKAKEKVLKTFESFSPIFADKAREIINSKHIDVYPSPVKKGGAFCDTISPDIVPYIMLNHANNMDSVFTLAHELGHGIHSLYARNHSIMSQQPSLPFAETASTFCEMIVFEELFNEIKDNKIKKAMLSERMSKAYATIIRQNYFVKFEIMAYEEIKKGITAEKLSDLYFENLKEQFGNSIDIDTLFRYEWTVIPHIFNSPFYCYAYNFGELLSLALYSEYKKKGKKFIPVIEKILSYGGSKKPEEVLKEIGIDINSPEFWQASFDIIKVWQKQLESYAYKN